MGNVQCGLDWMIAWVFFLYGNLHIFSQYDISRAMPQNPIPQIWQYSKVLKPFVGQWFWAKWLPATFPVLAEVTDYQLARGFGVAPQQEQIFWAICQTLGDMSASSPDAEFMVPKIQYFPDIWKSYVRILAICFCWSIVELYTTSFFHLPIFCSQNTPPKFQNKHIHPIKSNKLDPGL